MGLRSWWQGIQGTAAPERSLGFDEWMSYFQFGNLDTGTYEVRVTRNGDLAAETSFEVT